MYCGLMPEQIELLCSRWGLNPPTERETELLIRSGQLETCFFGQTLQSCSCFYGQG